MVTGRRAKGAGLAAIRRWAREIAASFRPERIVLFGSHAYGRPHADSDVDILVVMPAANEMSQAIRLTLALDPPFSLDLIVRTPEHLRRGLEEGDSFLCEVISKGKVLYEEAHLFPSLPWTTGIRARTPLPGRPARPSAN